MSTAETAGQFNEMWQRSLEPYLRLVRQFTPVNSAFPDYGKMQQRYVDFASNEGAAAYRKMSELSANYYSALLDAGMNLSQDFYQQVYQTKPVCPAPAPSVTPVRELVFTGPIGTKASRAFVVSNRTDQPAKVSFELSEFVPENGADKVRLDAQLVPSSFELPGHGERTVDCALPLTKALAPDVEYRAVLRVIGFPNMQIGLMVRAEAAPTKTPARPAAAKVPKRKKRKG